MQCGGAGRQRTGVISPANDTRMGRIVLRDRTVVVGGGGVLLSEVPLSTEGVGPVVCEIATASP